MKKISKIIDKIIDKKIRNGVKGAVSIFNVRKLGLKPVIGDDNKITGIKKESNE